MDRQKPATRKELIAIGLLSAAIGLYFALVGLGFLPIPGGKGNLHAPLWVVFLAGLVFFLGGAAALLQVAGGANANAELPADAPRWMRAAQSLIMLAIFGAFALTASWIAFGAGERNITATTPFFSGPASEWIGRGAFGLGAIILWLCTAGMTVSMVRKILGREKAR